MEEKLEQIVAWNVINFPITCKIARYKLRTIPTDLGTIAQLAPPGTPRHGIQFLVTAFTRNILPASWRRNNNSTAFLLFSRTHSSLYRRELHPRVRGLPRKRPSSFPTMARGRASQFQQIYRPTFRLHDLCDTLFPGKDPRESEISPRCCLNWQRNSPMNPIDLAPPRHGETWPHLV